MKNRREIHFEPSCLTEQGCSEYRLHQDNEDPARFIFYETWDSPACLERHMNTSHFTEYLAAAEGMIAEKTVYQMTALE